MIPSRRLLLALAGLALTSLALGLVLPPHWQGLPALGALLLLVLAMLERQRPRWSWAGLWQRPPAQPMAGRARRRPAPLHLLIDSQAPAGRSTWQQDRDQALGFARAVATGGNLVRLYGLDPILRLLAASTADGSLPPASDLEPGAAGALKAGLAQLCRNAEPGSLIVVVAPLAEDCADWLARLEGTGRELTFWLISTSLRVPAEPERIRSRRSARAYAEAWRVQLRHEHLATRLERLGHLWLPAGGKTSLQARLLRLWEVADSLRACSKSRELAPNKAQRPTGVTAKGWPEG